MAVYVLMENRFNKIKNPSLESLSAAKKLAEKFSTENVAILFGDAENISDLGKYGADRVIKVNTGSDLVSRDVIIDVVTEILNGDSEFKALFASATSFGKDIIPGVSARFKKGIAQDVTELFYDKDPLLIKRPVFAGKAFEIIKFNDFPYFITTRPNVFKKNEYNSEGKVEEIEKSVSEDGLKTVLKEVKSTGSGQIELTEANVIVSGGRGMKGPENFKIIEELASLLNAAVGASRAAVDEGWIDHQHQVGQTGKTVSPTVYIACGISGAIQHLAGMSSSKYIIAINKDPDAPIFKVADLGIVGDLFKVVPALTEELKKVLNK